MRILASAILDTIATYIMLVTALVYSLGYHLFTGRWPWE